MILNYQKQINGKPSQMIAKVLLGEKKHSIRKDPHNRWKAGMTIHHTTGSRTKDYKCHRKDVCKCVQRIDITYIISNEGLKFPSVRIDGKLITLRDDIYLLAVNDGFNSVKEFYEYFDKDCVDWKIIHWTDHKYEPSADRLDRTKYFKR